MLFLFRRLTLSVLAILVCHTMLTATAFAQAKKFDFKPRPGVVWFIGSITSDEDGLPTIDMGDAHGVTEGESVALFRPVDGYFEPVGSVKVDQTFVTWSLPARTRQITPKVGDRVVYVRTLSQLGDAENFRERFLEHQIVKTGVRNGYSTLQLQEQADALANIMARQPRWQRDQKQIAGYLRSPSISIQDLEELKPCLKQVMRFQDFSTLRIPVANAVGNEWASVLDTLTPEIADSFPEHRPQISEAPKPEETSDKNPEEVAAKSAEAAEQQAQEDAALKLRIARIQKNVDTMLFSRPVEQRRVIIMLCTALEKFRPSQEGPWFSAEMQLTQFPLLKDDTQLLEDFAAVMRKVREQQ